MRYRRLITIGAVVAACGALGGAPALASQSSASHQAVVAAARPGHALGAAVHPGHAVAVPDSGPGCNVMNCFLEDGGDICVSADGAHCTPFRTPIVGIVFQNDTFWPYSDHQFDTLYVNNEVLQFIDQDNGLCLQTDGVHSPAVLGSCGSHNANTYWMTLGGGDHGVCTPGFWMVNVGITNFYSPGTYPYGYAMYYNPANPINGVWFVQPHRPIGNDDQFCAPPQSK